jgi:hypothetical protein
MAIRHFTLPSGKVVEVEVASDRKDGLVEAGASDLAGAIASGAAAGFVQSFAASIEITELALQGLLERATRPEEVSITLGLKVGATGNVIVAKGTAEANITVTAKYSLAAVKKKSEDNQDSANGGLADN